MRLGQTSLVYFISKVVGSAIGFLATIYFARVLGEEVLGFYALVLTLVTWFSLVGQVGVSKAVTKRISEGREQAEYATAGLIIILSLGTLVGIAVVGFRTQIEGYVGRPVALFVILIVVAVLLKSLFFATLKGHHLVHLYAPLSTLKLTMRSLFQIALVYLGFRLTGLLIGYAAGAVFAVVASLLVLGFRPALPSRKHFVRLYDYAKYSWLGSVRGRTFDQFDILVLGVFVPAGLIGVYSVAWTLSKFLDLFGSAVSTTMFPEMSEVSTKQDLSAVSGLVNDSLGYAGLMIIPGLVGATVLADRLMAIYGEGFVVGQTVLPILIAALLIYTYNKQLTNTLNAIDRPDLAFRVNGVFIGANIILNVVLIWQIGWVGAAIATGLSAFAGLLVAGYYAKQLVSFSIPVDVIAQQWVAALGMGLVVFLARSFGETRFAWVDQYNAAFVVLLVTLGAGVYFGALFLVSSGFRTTVRENLPAQFPGSRI